MCAGEWISSAVCMYIAYYMVTWFGVEHRVSISCTCIVAIIQYHAHQCHI